MENKDICPHCTYGEQLHTLLTMIEKRRKQLHDRGDGLKSHELDHIIGLFVAETVLKKWEFPEISLA